MRKYCYNHTQKHTSNLAEASGGDPSLAGSLPCLQIMFLLLHTDLSMGLVAALTASHAPMPSLHLGIMACRTTVMMCVLLLLKHCCP